MAQRKAGKYSCVFIIDRCNRLCVFYAVTLYFAMPTKLHSHIESGGKRNKNKASPTHYWIERWKLFGRNCFWQFLCEHMMLPFLMCPNKALYVWHTQKVMYINIKPDQFCPREECHDTCEARGAASFVWTKPEVAGNSKICYCKVGKDNHR